MIELTPTNSVEADQLIENLAVFLETEGAVRLRCVAAASPKARKLRGALWEL